jgi:hypothetical protein
MLNPCRIFDIRDVTHTRPVASSVREDLVLIARGDERRREEATGRSAGDAVLFSARKMHSERAPRAPKHSPRLGSAQRCQTSSHRATRHGSWFRRTPLVQRGSPFHGRAAYVQTTPMH